MDELGTRIQSLRKENGLSQNELAKKIQVSKAQMSRYEVKGVQPPADVLNKMADVLNTSVDFLINGDMNEKASTALKNTKLLQKFKDIAMMPEEEQNILLQVIGAYIRDFKTRQAYAV